MAIIIIKTLFNEDAYLTIVNLPYKDLKTQNKYKKNNYKKKNTTLQNNIIK